jgi:lipopolysaccharide/colanic/teichoic acid biosynthesis glycosyltransferase
MYSLLKRSIDFAVALIAILLLAPLFIPLMIALKFTAEGKIFYLQQRIGKDNKPFHIYKFATMLENSMNMGLGATTVRNDPRITPVGKYLRMTKINELPQLLNVLKGDMSFVGARPLPEKSFAKYTDEVKKVIYQTRPGITGIGSLIFRDEELLATTVKTLGVEPIDYYKQYIYPYKGAVELWYQKNSSFWTDTKILFLTFWQIVSPKSNLLFRALPNLPERPKELTIKGIHKLYAKMEN